MYIVKNIYSKYIILIIFSFCINTYYGNQGVFPMDTFAFFDTGYNITIGRHPFKDIWITTGPLVDYIQAFFFKIFGLTWNSYVFHASFLNSISVAFFYYTLLKFNFDKNYSFIYAILLSILLYTVSGTPFAYLHSYIFSLIAILLFIIGTGTKSKMPFFALPIIMFFAFFSMQNPSTFIIFTILILLVFFFIKYDYFGFKYFIFGIFFSIILFFFYIYFTKVSVLDIWNQYFLFPLSLGENRILGNSTAHFSLSERATLRNIFGHFKFINFYILIIILFTFFKIKKKQITYEIFLINILLIFSGIFLIFNQLITSNQTYIFSFIIFIGSFTHLFLKKNFLLKKQYEFLLLVLVIFITAKYHLEYNEKRKFMDLQFIDLKKYVRADVLDKKFKNLKWISPNYPYDPKKEIELLIDAKKLIKSDNEEKMVITHYQFFSILLEQNLNTPNRWYTPDNNSYPLFNHNLFSEYKNHLKKILIKKNIRHIYTVGKIKFKIFLIYFDDVCFDEKKLSQIVFLYKIKSCT